MKATKKGHLDTLQRIGSILLIIIAVFGAAMPVAGFSFSLGYISVFGIDADTFPRTIGDLWQQSFTASLLWLTTILEAISFLIKPLLFLFFTMLAFFIFLILLLVAGKLSLISPEKGKSIVDKVQLVLDFPSTLSKDKDLKDLTKQIQPIIITLACLALITFLYIFLVYPYQEGRKLSQKALDNYNKSGCISDSWSNCVEYFSPNDPLVESFTGLLVAASSSHIAIFDGEKTSIIPRNPEYVLMRAYKAKGEKTEEADSLDTN